MNVMKTEKTIHSPILKFINLDILVIRKACNLLIESSSELLKLICI